MLICVSVERPDPEKRTGNGVAYCKLHSLTNLCEISRNSQMHADEAV